MVTIIALIVLLVCILFIKSTIIIEMNMPDRPAKVNVLVSIACAALAFIPIAKWVILFLVPIVTIFWYCTGGFDDDGSRAVELSDETTIGKILLFKI